MDPACPARRFYVYVITNTVNGKRYVGKAKQPAKRWSHHKTTARGGGGFALHRAMRKHGVDAFRHDVLAAFATEQESFVEEQRLIALYGTRHPDRGYNETAGGEGCSGRPMPDRARAALAAYNANRGEVSDETRARMRSAAIARREADPKFVEQLARTNAGRKGEKRPGAGALVSAGKAAARAARGGPSAAQAAASSARRGVPLSAEHRAKLSAARRRNVRPQTDDGVQRVLF